MELPKSSEIEPWRAGGYAIWLQSSDLSERITSLATSISQRYPGVYPVIDGHVTLVGNIGKKIPINEEEMIEHMASWAKPGSFAPLVLKYNKVGGQVARPSKALYIEAEPTQEWIELRKRVLKDLGLEADDQPSAHASIVYNQSGNYPLTQEILNDLVSEVSGAIQLPLEIKMDQMIAVATIGLPKEWRQLTPA